MVFAFIYSGAMQWSIPQSLKEGFFNTILCFLSCSFGMALSMLYFASNYWIFQIIIALLVSYSISQTLFYFWQNVISAYKLQLGIQHNHIIHLVSIAIMMLVSYLIMYAWPNQHAAHQIPGKTQSTIASFPKMFLTMCFGFLVALPYNVYNAGSSNKKTPCQQP